MDRMKNSILIHRCRNSRDKSQSAHDWQLIEYYSFLRREKSLLVKPLPTSIVQRRRMFLIAVWNIWSGRERRTHLSDLRLVAGALLYSPQPRVGNQLSFDQIAKDVRWVSPHHHVWPIRPGSWHRITVRNCKWTDSKTQQLHVVHKQLHVVHKHTMRMAGRSQVSRGRCWLATSRPSNTLGLLLTEVQRPDVPHGQRGPREVDGLSLQVFDLQSRSP